MTAQVSPVFTPMHNEEARLLVTSNEEALRKVIRNLNTLGNMLPLGHVATVNTNQAGVPPIDTSMYQYCDGSEITNPLSPLRSIGLSLNFTPNMVNKFPRGAALATGNATGGDTAWNLAHNHGGNTTAAGGGATDCEEGDEQRTSTEHTHTIAASLEDGTLDWPAWVGLAPYMKIR